MPCTGRVTQSHLFRVKLYLLTRLKFPSSVLGNRPNHKESALKFVKTVVAKANETETSNSSIFQKTTELLMPKMKEANRDKQGQTQIGKLNWMEASNYSLDSRKSSNKTQTFSIPLDALL